MRLHPAVLMLMVWAGCIATFYTLPFQLVGRVMTLYGFLILMLFIAAFCFGSLAAARPQPQRPRPTNLAVDFRLTDRILMIAAAIAVFAALIDVQGRNLFDLAEAYQQRSDAGSALLEGGASSSSIWFQIYFLTYPAGYVFLVREAAYRPKPALWRIACFGLAPVALAALAMGGRAPLFYAMVVLVYGFALRKQLFIPQVKTRPSVRTVAGQAARRTFKLGGPEKLVLGLAGAMAAIYFIQVFFARADVVGGLEVMFGVAETSWGVNFNGRFSGIIFGLLGVDGTYLLFIFVWYLVQGLVMSNAIFTDYQGAMLFGGYGIDLMGALMRRLNGEFLARGFADLLHLNVYGFLPSAFGSLFVDLHFFGLIPCVIWGWLTGKVYGAVRQGQDPRWLLTVPFISVGIFFSLINTPIGFSNGLVTHLWLVAALIAARARARPVAGPPALTRTPT